MEKFGVLVVDDSSFMRKCITKIIEKNPKLYVVGIARDGYEAIEKVQNLNPDVVTMDIEMPNMNGIMALKKIKELHDIPIVMLSNYTEEGAKPTIEALEAGAEDFFLKSELIKQDVDDKVIDYFINKLINIVESKKVQKQCLKINMDEMVNKRVLNNDKPNAKTNIIIIGTSTGGPAALQSILPNFPADLSVPVLVLQHMPPGFTKSLAERFDTFCQLHVKEAEDDEVLQSGNIYIAPSGFQTTLHLRSDNRVSFKITDSSNDNNLYKPSIDVTLNSAAPIYKDHLLVAILTGMGNDGVVGCKSVKENGGHVIIESENTCVVYGMPKAVFEAKLYDVQVPLQDVLKEILTYV
ncbi:MULTISPECIES: protein-glutamate methylesterase/protein-glutamine glutaminase [Thermoanaerobacterium]|uniref:Protein-glutamate methylesterase/protein-glutamine glutaminase n=3 Tax=Thermoanaerobacterium TaxID=28895 RepID=W9ECE9_9THEO|nr:chemotaxis response regulator protein-glutamate methylesterase [Thermoanaerobacterium aotearoense]AFK85163.1 response regulator receiver modulated CheB methylesterase [Thermoanaerobacterium saccharolyticum JW/SL-YS485]ETO39767.1 response regulator receiver modulated CheB methylesterase [Thermoanaerobacterium aotearoense SCUT27]